ncbi:MAG: hypothetical protein ACJAWV_001698 [Flammeovirgaceae bacterium]
MVKEFPNAKLLPEFGGVPPSGTFSYEELGMSELLGFFSQMSNLQNPTKRKFEEGKAGWSYLN